MNSVQLHLALTHVPVILSLAGVAMLIISFFIKNNTLTKTAYIVLLVAGIAAIPVFLTGEGAEEAVERLPGVSEAIIEEHEELAKFAMIMISVAGAFSLAAFFFMHKPSVTRIFRFVVLLVGMATAVLMLQTAHLGGQIRHTEARSGAVIEDAKGAGKNLEQQKEQDDD